MQPRHQLAALIQAVEDANGWSDPEVADRARQRGHTISKSNISRMRLEPVRSIKGDAIKALAAGLAISPLDVADAALASMGVHRSNSAGNDAESAIKRDPLLSETQRRLLLTLLSEMRSDLPAPTPSNWRDVDPLRLAASPSDPREAVDDVPDLSAWEGRTAARTSHRISEGERKHRQIETAGEESQDNGADFEGA